MVFVCVCLCVGLHLFDFFFGQARGALDFDVLALAGALIGGGDAEYAVGVDGEFDLDLTSVRGLIGKDILGVGLMAGGGWDRLSGNGDIRARVSPTGPESMAGTSELTSDRLTFFGGGSVTYLILQLSVEMGWSRALDPELPLVPEGANFPSNKAYFGSLGARVTF